MKAIDLFAGWGGFTLGATQAGATVEWAADHWPVAVETARPTPGDAGVSVDGHHLGAVDELDTADMPEGFPDSYEIDPVLESGQRPTLREQVAACGNSVSPPVAAALVAANVCARRAAA